MQLEDYENEALRGRQYYEAILVHRRNYIFKQGVNYDTHHPDTISFLPPDEVQDELKKDYEQMKEQIIYGKSVPEFNAMMKRLADL